jgi:hypothetical protein
MKVSGEIFTPWSHARRQQREFIDLAIDDQGMAGIVAALKADHHVGPLGEPVDDLAFSFVAPLGADDCDVCHGYATFAQLILIYRRGLQRAHRARDDCSPDAGPLLPDHRSR